MFLDGSEASAPRSVAVSNSDLDRNDELFSQDDSIGGGK